MGNIQEQAKILTEEELSHYNELFRLQSSSAARVIFKLIASHQLLLSANAELSFEIMIRKHYEGFLKSVARSGEILEERRDFEWFKERWQSIENLVLEVSHE